MTETRDSAAGFSNEDKQWMQRALELARRGVGLVSPNPTVACVLVKDGKNVGEGFHLYAMRDHAEIVAMRAAGENAKGATAYVTLEPCSHRGRTGPCSEALIAAGVRRVVAATLDANQAVRGNGLAKLKAAGVEVASGLMQSEARELNNAFAKYIQTGLPFVTLKAALSRDGYLAPAKDKRTAKQSYRLTGAAADAEVQRLRHEADAILTGIGTVLADDPRLTDRSGLERRRPLLRVVMDSTLQLPMDSALVKSAQEDLLVLCGRHADLQRQQQLEQHGVAVVRCDGEHPQPSDALRELARWEVTHVLLEAGAQINGAFLEAEAVDELVFFYTPHVLGAGSVPFTNNKTPLKVLENYEQKLVRVVHGTLQEDTSLRGLLRDPWQGVG